MNRSTIILSMSVMAATAYGQSAIDAFRISQPDLKGTARFMSMGGAFGALGGDLSTLSQNPAGIGVYRSNEIGFTVDLDFQSASASSQGSKVSTDQTKFLLNNIGGVFTMKLPSETMPNVNFGFTYNKSVSFNRRYAGVVPNLNTSLSNYIAGVTNSAGIQAGEFNVTYPYEDGNLPWISTLGYQGYLIDSSGEGSNTKWYGQWGSGTSGFGAFDVKESGSVEDYNIAIGGNISNVVYWGMNFDIVNVDYAMNSIWGENLENAYVPNPNGGVDVMGAAWNLNNYYNVKGSGFKYSLGVIVKPIQELRIGLAFHTPTWYNLDEYYGASVNYKYEGESPSSVSTNDGLLGANSYDFRTPLKFSASLAGVIGSNFILSMDYELTPYNKMKFASPGSYGFNNGWAYGPDDYPYYYSSSPTLSSESLTRSNSYDDPYYESNSDIDYYYQASHTFRLGAEYRVTPAFSLRAGYSHTTSPVKQSARNDQETIYTSGTLPNYRFDNHTNYITCGFGYRHKQFSVDMAYVYKNVNSVYHAFTPDVDYDTGVIERSPQSSLSLNNSQVVLSAGYRF